LSLSRASCRLPPPLLIDASLMLLPSHYAIFAVISIAARRCRCHAAADFSRFIFALPLRLYLFLCASPFFHISLCAL